MKFLIVFACALAAASAGQIVAPLLYGAQHLPVIGANGVPVDTAEVQIARAQHLAHKVEAHVRNGDVALAAPLVSAYSAAPLLSAYQTSPLLAGAYFGLRAYAPAAYPTTAVLPSSVNGVPLETPEVQAARLNHYAAHAEANARNGNAAILLRKRRGIIAAPVAYSSPIVASYAHAPVVSTYAAAPQISTTVYRSAPVVSAYSTAYPYAYSSGLYL